MEEENMEKGREEPVEGREEPVEFMNDGERNVRQR